MNVLSWFDNRCEVRAVNKHLDEHIKFHNDYANEVRKYCRIVNKCLEGLDECGKHKDICKKIRKNTYSVLTGLFEVE